MTPEQQQPKELIVQIKCLKPIEDYIYSTMNHTPEWEQAERAFQYVLHSRPHPAPAYNPCIVENCSTKYRLGGSQSDGGWICSQAGHIPVKNIKVCPVHNAAIERKACEDAVKVLYDNGWLISDVEQSLEYLESLRHPTPQNEQEQPR